MIGRKAAMDFAKAHWNTVCDDGVFWLTDESINVERKRRELGAPASAGWEFRFLPDGHGEEHAVFLRTAPTREEKIVQEWEGLADCAHFISRCLQAGGLHGGSLDVAQLVHLLQARHDTKTLAERVTRAQGQNIIDSGILQVADVIGYFNNSPTGDFDRIGYSHSTLYGGKISGVGRVTCHTKSRFPGLTPAGLSDEWHLENSNYTFTFIHFFGDDKPPRPEVLKVLPGWWQISGSPRVSGSPPLYQFVDAGGHAYWTNRKPESARSKLPAVETAYWFDDGSSNITFTWRKTGTVDVWTTTASSGTTSVNVVTNSATPRQATRMFP